MRILVFLFLAFFSITSNAQQLKLPLKHSHDILRDTHYSSDNVRLSNKIPEEITKAWDERDFGFEIADGYYGYGPSAQYEILNDKNEVIGYMLVQTLSYSEDPEYHVAYTISDTEGRVVVELEYDVYHLDEVNDLPEELRPDNE